MCGIVGAAAQRDVAPILLEGLKRLEYRGYDSAGIAVIDEQHHFHRQRRAGKVKELARALEATPLAGATGIAHTRWASHGEPSEKNAHPHICNDLIAVVHNGIIENFQALKEKQTADGFTFTSDTDTEVVAHQIVHHLNQGKDLLAAVIATTQEIHGAYALGVIHRKEPGRVIGARQGSPLVLGVGIGENFIASDAQALLPVTQNFIYLENGDIADVTRESLQVYNREGEAVERETKTSTQTSTANSREGYRHYMLKEIHEQPRAIADTLMGRIIDDQVDDNILGDNATAMLDQIKAVQIVACGTSYHAGLIAKYWFEGLAGIPCQVEVASEYRYRPQIVPEGCLFLTITQSGETADTLAALGMAKQIGYLSTLCICNVAESSIVRESDYTLLTHAGPEIGVASTKAFTTQLTALLLLLIVIGRRKHIDAAQQKDLIAQLRSLPARVQQTLALDAQIEQFSNHLADKHHALFLGRGMQYPVAMEGALKLKEISYIHAEAYPAGELKHGPLALVDEDMPVIAVAPNNELLEKLHSNLQEVRARGGKLMVFADAQSGLREDADFRILTVAPVDDVIAPLIYSVPLQLLAYHAAVLKGTDVDQPRNLAKSVTIE